MKSQICPGRKCTKERGKPKDRGQRWKKGNNNNKREKGESQHKSQFRPEKNISKIDVRSRERLP